MVTPVTRPWVMAGSVAGRAAAAAGTVVGRVFGPAAASPPRLSAGGVWGAGCTPRGWAGGGFGARAYPARGRKGRTAARTAARRVITAPGSVVGGASPAGLGWRGRAERRAVAACRGAQYPRLRPAAGFDAVPGIE